MKRKINKDNFFDATFADFKSCKVQTKKPDFISASGSKYWFTKGGVIRESDHWGVNIASCDWFIDGNSFRDTKREKTKFGFCSWKGFFEKISYKFEAGKRLFVGNACSDIKTYMDVRQKTLLLKSLITKETTIKDLKALLKTKELKGLEVYDLLNRKI